jgi:hypothetical protein
MKRQVAVALMVVMAGGWLEAAAKPQSEKVFYIFAEKKDPRNHYIPSGYMGDFSDIKVNEGDTTNPADGRNAIKIVYDAKAAQGANWAGIYWQNPANNWGEKQGGGYDLTKYKKLTLWARGEKGGEQLAKFCTGGITGTFMDSDQAESAPITLTKEWKKYEIDLAGKDMRNISGGFCWAASKDENPDGFTFYLDEIRFE